MLWQVIAVRYFVEWQFREDNIWIFCYIGSERDKFLPFLDLSAFSVTVFGICGIN